MGNKGYVAFLLGEEVETRELLTQAFAIGGEVIRKQELDDSQIHPLPQDKRFRELISSISVPSLEPAMEKPSVSGRVWTPH